MDKTNCLNKNEKNLVKMGMVDSKFADAMFFLADMNNPLRSIRKARIKFLYEWFQRSRLQREPNINLFFEIPNEEWLFVHDKWCGECRQGKRLFLDRETMSRPDDIIVECLRAYEISCRMWESWRESKIHKMDECFKHQKPELKLVKG